MKILGVRFLNLNSLKGEHELRFDQSPLADSGLFAITGPTGAGKTTILDAITVGLYGLVHRHNQDRPHDLMTRHTGESYAEVEFESNGNKYRSKWSIKRSRGKADGKLQAIHMEFYDFKADQLLDLRPSQVPDKVTEICGLDYSQFLRSVMLSQGDFARFLKAKENERSGLLEKITDTGIYSDISRYAYEKAKTERLAKEDLERQLQNKHLLTEEELSAYHQEVQTLESQLQTLKQEEETLKRQRQWLQHLDQLRAKENRLQADLEQQLNRQEALRPDFARLQQHEHAHRYQGELARIHVTGSTLERINQQLGELEQNIPALEQQREAAREAAAHATACKEEQEKVLADLEPVLTQVLQADRDINNAQTQYEREKAKLTQTGRELEAQAETLRLRKQHLEELTLQGQGMKKWLAENERDRDLREHLQEFRDLLRDLKEAESQAGRLQKEAQGLQGQLREQTHRQQEITGKETEVRQRLEALQQEKKARLTELHEALQGQEMEALEENARLLPDRLNRLDKQHDLALEHQRLATQQTHLQTRIQENEKTLAETSQVLTIRQQELRQAEEQLATLQKIVDLQARIVQLEEARHLLQPGEECPLCGSVHHPFVENNYTSRLTEEEAKRQEQLARVEQLQTQSATLQVQATSLRQKLDFDRETLERLKTDLHRLADTFAQLNMELGAAHALAQPEKLQQLVEEEKNTQTKLQQTLLQARHLAKETERLNQQHQHHREELLRLESQREQATHTIGTLQERHQTLATELQDFQEQMQNHTVMAASFTASYGLAFEADRRQEALHQLERRCERHQQVERDIQELREPFVKTRSEVQHLEQQLEKEQAEQAQRREALQKSAADLADLQAARKQLFGERDPQQVRHQTQQHLRQCTTQAEEARNHLLRCEQHLQEHRNRQQSCLTDQETNGSLLTQLKKALLEVLQPEGIATIEALSQMLLHKEEATRLANLRQQTEKQRIELQTSLADVQRELRHTTALALTTAPAEEVEQAIQEKTEALTDLLTQRGRLQQLLEQDAATRAQHCELAARLQTQQQVCQRWDALASIIGSADGNKFSRFAQGLTLARLVELANRHLLRLNDRYRIQKSAEQDLELLIVDTFQADAIRPMNTLSGGESFLVSLALALGLSDLAGRRTQIRSLFIDEGFGTLDADTLDTAISTLENLQADGKMIGIISHVDALKERISTQIRVRKLAAGISRIDVTGPMSE